QPLASASEAAQRREHDARRGQASAADIIQRGIEKGFTPEDVLGEAQARRTIVLLGKEPQFSVEPEPVPGEEVAASLPELTPEQAAALDAVLAAVLNAEGEASPMGDEERARMEAVLRADLRAWLFQHLGSDP